jgi:hypothetical protein
VTTVETMSVTDRRVSTVLRELAEQSAKAADAGGSEADLLDAYEAPGPAVAPGRQSLREALHHLSAWATGVRLAYETREDERGPDA